MISHLTYVSCDRCGCPAGGADDMAEDSKGARENARRLGFTRKASACGGGPRMLDLCPRCTEIES
jgi:hypothetical protein